MKIAVKIYMNGLKRRPINRNMFETDMRDERNIYDW